VKIEDTLTFFLAKGACGGCGKEQYAFRRACGACGRRYPTARPVYYWAYVAIIVMAVPALLAFAWLSWN
jgi:uncharacterized protein (DUF983 family)